MTRRIRLPELYAGLTSRIWIASLPLFYSIRGSSLIVLEHEQAGATAAGVPTPISSIPPFKRWWPWSMGREGIE